MPDHRATRVEAIRGINIQATSPSGRTFQQIRNDFPPSRGYVYRAPRPDWAIRALAAAEAVHGKPPADDVSDGECGGCGQRRRIIDRSHGMPVCSPCWRRWKRKDFTADGPGPSMKPRIIDSAREHQAVITSMNIPEAAAVLGKTPRTIQRWRTALREAS
jgi:hypothetical protein